jgi:uncharacterized membrane protein YhaH (DUF805 family)
MMKQFVYFILIFTHLFLITTHSQEEFKKSPKESWVEPIPVDYNRTAPKNQISAGSYFLHYETQENLTDEQYTVFRKVVKKALNTNGVTSLSQISIDFDPSYQTISFHELNLFRKGKWLDRMKKSRFTVLQREDQLESQLIDGRKTLSVIIDDIEVGDILQYSYSNTGINPNFDGKYFNSFATEFSIPIGTYAFKLRCPSNRILNIKYHGPNQSKLQISLKNDTTEYSLIRQNLHETEYEDHTPSWYHPYPWIQISEMSYWEQVHDWGMNLFKIKDGKNSLYQEKLGDLKAGHQTEEATALAAIRFVQDKIRYMGIEIGASSHRPSAPETVLQRKFGDCKDKSLLLASLLNDLGFEAYPALVNTRLDEKILDRLPSPILFNHAIVQLIFNGRTYWIDPSYALQGGTLDTCTQPDYKCALLLNKDTKQLVKQTWKENELPSRHIEMSFDITTGYFEPAILVVKTTYRKHKANNMRYDLLNTNLPELQKDYLNYYAGSFPEIETVGGLNVSDDIKKNEIIITETYKVSHIFVEDKEEGTHTLSVQPDELMEYLRQPSVKHRKQPLAIAHPVHDRHSTVIKFPDDYFSSAETDNESYSTSNIRLEMRYMYQKKALFLDYEYWSKTDHIPVNKVTDYLQTLKRIVSHMGYYLPITSASESYSNDSTPQESPTDPVGALLGAILAAFAITLLRKIVKNSDTLMGEKLGYVLEGLYSFQGRFTRSMFYLFYFSYTLFAFFTSITAGFTSGIICGIFSIDLQYMISPIMGAMYLSGIWTSLAFFIKRFHDRDKSGFAMFMLLIPIVGAVWFMLEIYFFKGTEGANRFGKDPLMPQTPKPTKLTRPSTPINTTITRPPQTNSGETDDISLDSRNKSQ